jgi:transcriptional regulator with XRE-family HTH domain
MNSLGVELKSQRGQRNMTQSEAAAKIGIEQSFLSKLESDQSWASVDVLRRICKAYGMRPAQLLAQVDIDCLRGNVNYQSLLADDRRRRSWFMGIGALCTSLIFVVLIWAAAQQLVVLPGLQAVPPEPPLMSMDFEGLPAEMALTMIADLGGFTIANPQLLAGKQVTLNVASVHWREVLALTLAQLALSGELQGSVLALQTTP